MWGACGGPVSAALTMMRRPAFAQLGVCNCAGPSAVPKWSRKRFPRVAAWGAVGGGGDTSISVHAFERPLRLVAIDACDRALPCGGGG